MSKALVLDVHALGRYRAALARFFDESIDTLEQAGGRLRRKRDWLEAQLMERRAVLRRAEIQLTDAKHQLQRCLAAQGPEGGPDCSGHAQAVSASQRAVEQAAGRVRIAEQCRVELDAAASRYEQASRRFAQHLVAQVPLAASVLDRFGRALDGYLAAQVVGAPPPTEAHETLGNGLPGQRPPLERVGTTGLVHVPLSMIDLTDSPVAGPESYGKVPYAEMRRGLFSLEEKVLPAVSRGAVGDDFSQLDQRRALGYADGFRRIYDSFFGDGAILLDWHDGSFHVTNGYHRLQIARELGWKTIPARVTLSAGGGGGS